VATIAAMSAAPVLAQRAMQAEQAAASVLEGFSH
jgi:hypothetical protein